MLPERASSSVSWSPLVLTAVTVSRIKDTDDKVVAPLVAVTRKLRLASVPALAVLQSKLWRPALCAPSSRTCTPRR